MTPARAGMRFPKLHPLVWLVGIAGTVLLLALATSASVTVATLDASAVRGMHVSVVEPPRTEWVLGLTTLAGSDAALIVTVIASMVLALLRHWQGAVVLLLSVLVTQVVVDVLKGVVARRRPGDGPVADPTSFSFPSGHSATAVALYLTLALVAVHALRGPARVVAAVAGLMLVATIGASRVYLGVHYPTDVVAGWLTGAAVVLCCWATVTWVRRARPWERLVPAR